MATKAGEQEEAEVQAPETPDGPLLDLSDAAVRKMIKLAKKRGYVTYDELNEVLPSDQNSSDQIEDIYAMLSDMGIKSLPELKEALRDPKQSKEVMDELVGVRLGIHTMVCIVRTPESESTQQDDEDRSGLHNLPCKCLIA